MVARRPQRVRIGVGLPASFGADNHLLAFPLQRVTEQLFALAVFITVRGIKKVNPGVQRFVHQIVCRMLRHHAEFRPVASRRAEKGPFFTKRHGAKTEL